MELETTQAGLMMQLAHIFSDDQMVSQAATPLSLKILFASNIRKMCIFCQAWSHSIAIGSSLTNPIGDTNYVICSSLTTSKTHYPTPKPSKN